MPALPSVSKVVRVDLFQTIGGNTRVRDRIFFSYTAAGPSAADLTTFLTTVANSWGTNLSALQCTNCSLTSLEATDLTSATAAQQVFSTSKVGTASGQVAVTGAAAIIKFKIARRYRGGHPRFYFAGFQASQVVTPPALQSAFTTLLASDWGAFINGCIATPPASMGTVAHVNVSYFSGFSNKLFPSGREHPVPTLRGTPTVDTVISYSVNPNVGSQRRRNQQSI